jgi:hypothetical protein
MAKPFAEQVFHEECDCGETRDKFLKDMDFFFDNYLKYKYSKKYEEYHGFTYDGTMGKVTDIIARLKKVPCFMDDPDALTTFKALGIECTDPDDVVEVNSLEALGIAPVFCDEIDDTTQQRFHESVRDAMMNKIREHCRR